MSYFLSLNTWAKKSPHNDLHELNKEFKQRLVTIAKDLGGEIPALALHKLGSYKGTV